MFTLRDLVQIPTALIGAMIMSTGAFAVEPLRVFDAHMHYNIEA